MSNDFRDDVLIIGCGVVGTNLMNEIGVLHPDHYDKFKDGYDKHFDHHKLGFVCVDTPLVDGIVDASEVENAINENECDIYVIKSTVPVGKTDEIMRRTGKHVMFSPEYYGGTQHCNNFDFNFTILGGDKADCLKVQQLLQKVYDARHVFRITDAKTAEIAKFMENSWLATKVSFCISFYEACRKTDISYEELRELFVLDPRVNPSHTFVYDEHPYYDSHCLNKDVPSIANQFDIQFLKELIGENKKRKTLYIS